MNLKEYRAIALAKVRSGQLPSVVDGLLLAKPGEIVHMAVDAELQAEVRKTSYTGGGSGGSIGFGPFRVGGSSRSGQRHTSTSFESVDCGTLSITSERAVFMGARQTVEFPYAKLMGFQSKPGSWRKDALWFHLPNRKLRPLLVGRDQSELVVAIIEAALARARRPKEAAPSRQRLEATSVDRRPRDQDRVAGAAPRHRRPKVIATPAPLSKED